MGLVFWDKNMLLDKFREVKGWHFGFELLFFSVMGLEF